MPGQIVTCARCGAPIEVPDDCRSYACRYCGAEVQVAVGADQIAAGLKLDLSNAGVFLTKLAHALETAVASRTRVHRSGAEVVGVELDLPPDVFVAKREAHAVVAQHKRVVRGIALKTATHPLDRWVEMVMNALAAHTNEDARASHALAAFFAGRS